MTTTVANQLPRINLALEALEDEVNRLAERRGNVIGYYLLSDDTAELGKRGALDLLGFEHALTNRSKQVQRFSL